MAAPISEQRPWSAATMPCSDNSSLGFPFQSLLIPMLLLSAPAQDAFVPKGALAHVCRQAIDSSQQRASSTHNSPGAVGVTTFRRERDISWTACSGGLLEGCPSGPFASIMLLDRIEQDENKRGQCKTYTLTCCSVSIDCLSTMSETLSVSAARSGAGGDQGCAGLPMARKLQIGCG